MLQLATANDEEDNSYGEPIWRKSDSMSSAYYEPDSCRAIISADGNPIAFVCNPIESLIKPK
jgi:hypothetical protein